MNVWSNRKLTLNRKRRQTTDLRSQEALLGTTFTWTSTFLKKIKFWRLPIGETAAVAEDSISVQSLFERPRRKRRQVRRHRRHRRRRLRRQKSSRASSRRRELFHFFTFTSNGISQTLSRSRINKRSPRRRSQSIFIF